MKTVSIISVSGKKAGTVELPDDVFDVQANVPLMHQVVVAQQAAARQGTHATRTRGQVRGGGKKPYRQKGTGRARQGSIRAPQYVGGGTVHGPVPRSYQQRTPEEDEGGGAARRAFRAGPARPGARGERLRGVRPAEDQGRGGRAERAHRDPARGRRAGRRAPR